MSAAALSQTAPAAAPAAPPAPAASAEQRLKIKGAAQAFEAQLISQLLQPMFEGLSTDGPFGGGQAEGTYSSFMIDAFGKQIAKSGGLGLAQPVMREMLRMQGLSQEPSQ